MLRTVLIGLFFCVLAGGAHAQNRASRIRSEYKKSEHMVPMRDGTRLFTAVYAPGSGGSYPILLVRTPYSARPYGVDRFPSVLSPDALYEKEKFVFVFQDVRGCFKSEGDFIHMTPLSNEINESTDAFDTIDWLVKNVPGNNGRVGQYGVSYPGFFAAAGMIESHPALVFSSPQAPIADWFWDDMHHNGALSLSLAVNFLAMFEPVHKTSGDRSPGRFEFGTNDGYQFFLDLGSLKNVNDKYFHHQYPFWDELVDHPNYDEFWQKRNLLPHLEGVTSAVMTVGGWYDAEDLYGALHVYQAVEKNNPNIFNILVMGPWRHGEWARGSGDRLGDANFGARTSEFYRKKVELPVLRHFLKGGPDPDLPEALVFDTGLNRWVRFPSWPPPDCAETALFFADQGSLEFECSASISGFDAFWSDPSRPVPHTQAISTDWGGDFMAEDQRFASRRPDVLVFKSKPLVHELTVAGPIDVSLWVSVTGSDADFVVKLIDGHPERGRDEAGQNASGGGDGNQILVRHEIFRARFRESMSNPRAMNPGTITQLCFCMWDVLHTFKAGHRIVVQVQSSFFPFFDRNPQTFVPNIFEAADKDFIKAEHRVYHTPEYPSKLVIDVVSTTSQSGNNPK